MTDKIVYLITAHGVDGRGQESIMYASWNEEDRDKALNASKNKAYYSIKKRIVEVEIETKRASAKLTGLDKLLLSQHQKVFK